MLQDSSSLGLKFVKQIGPALPSLRKITPSRSAFDRVTFEKMRPSRLVKVAARLVNVMSCAVQLMALAIASNSLLIPRTLTNLHGYHQTKKTPFEAAGVLFDDHLLLEARFRLGFIGSLNFLMGQGDFKKMNQYLRKSLKNCAGGGTRTHTTFY